MEYEMTPQEIRDDIADTDLMDPLQAVYTKGTCDVCDCRPGSHWVWAYGIDTWACDKCHGGL
jgi:hypothetical protein